MTYRFCEGPLLATGDVCNGREALQIRKCSARSATELQRGCESPDHQMEVHQRKC